MSRDLEEGSSLTSIDLFAGCGGLSLGLKKAGFDLAMANELSPMASQTFAYNFLDEDLDQLAEQEDLPAKTLWLSSSFDDLSSRLRENPFEYPPVGTATSDISQEVDLKGKLVVANIVHLNGFIKGNKKFKKIFSNGFYGKEIDLISGGPPCQSFSMAGLRKKDCDKNTLPFEFCEFVNLVRPRAVLLENVSGILRAFTQDEEKFYAWFEVAKAFANISYYPLCIHLNARQSEVPQNRPRFILIALREDVYGSLKPKMNDSEKNLFHASELLVKAENGSVGVNDFTCFDYQNTQHRELLTGSFLEKVFNHENISVSDAIGDLATKRGKPSGFVNSLNARYAFLGENKAENHDLRNNGDQVKKRFSLYQTLNSVDPSVAREVLQVLSEKLECVSLDSWKQLAKHRYYIGDGKFEKFGSLELFLAHIYGLKTKKHSQRALLADKPAPAALSIPDDVCHYDRKQLRTLTIREMARIQSFPDSFEFKSKITTGGTMRRFEVPQYTQVGNAVPPNLGYWLGCSIKELLER